MALFFFLGYTTTTLTIIALFLLLHIVLIFANVTTDLRVCFVSS
jgi:hypothetical protein